jgi:hypothetical protein
MVDAAQKFLCEPHHLLIIIAVLTLALIAGGKLGVLIRNLIKPKGNNVNIINKIEEKGGEVADDNSDRAHHVYCPDPSKCPAHAEERGRSLANQKAINDMRQEAHEYQQIFFKKLAFIGQQNAVMLRAMVKSGQLAEGDIPKESL